MSTPTPHRLILNAAEVRELAATGAVTVRMVVEHKSERPAEVWKHALQTDDGGWLFFDAEMGPSRDAAALAVAREHKGHQCPIGKPGDLCWVAEKFALVPRTAYWHDQTIPHRTSPDGHSWAVYAEGWERCRPAQWKSPARMPAWASRLTVRVISVTVEQRDGRWEWVVQAERQAA